MALIPVLNIPDNLNFYIFKKNKTIQEVAKIIGVPKSTLLALSRKKMSKTNQQTCEKIAELIGVPLETIQNELLEKKAVTEVDQPTSKRIREIDLANLIHSPLDKIKILNADYVTSNDVVNTASFVFQASEEISLYPIIKAKAKVVVNPVNKLAELKNFDIILLKSKQDFYLRVVKLSINSKTIIFNLLQDNMQLVDSLIKSEFEKRFDSIFKVIEIRT